MRKKDRSVVHHCVLCQDSENPWPLAAGNEGLLGRGSFDSAGPELPVEEEFALADSDKLALDELMAGDDQAPPATKATPSSLLGEKLLQGWTMMQESCPTCQEVPLMRNRNQELFCVGCDAFYNPNAKTPATNASPAAPPPGARTTVSPAAKAAEPSQPAVRNAIPDYQQTTAALKEKLHLLTLQLSQATFAAEIQAIAGAMEKVAQAISALDNLRS
ncbi:hypothetical protein HDV03_003546 [Kappamyces sp. JEL0829]|nr:hypothetical protein HDV03_003546 [Kappamyces sp. JEL0829]